MAQELTLKSILKDVNNRFGESTMLMGVPEMQARGTLSFGTPSLDYCLYGRLPEGTFIELNGLESSGKTTLAFLIAASYIRKEKQRNPQSPRKILFVDAECAADRGWALKAAGYDMNDKDVPTLYLSGAGQSAEEYFDIVRDCILTGEIGLVIFDSLTSIAGQQVNAESLEKKDMGGIAKVLGDFCKRTTGLFYKHNATFIGINGLSENISGYGEHYITPGGKTWKRACMVRMRVQKGDYFNADRDVVAKKDAQSPAGNIIEVCVDKSKVCNSDRRLGITHLSYANGIDILWDTIDVATILGLIESPAQGSFLVLDPDTGEVMKDSEGKEVKIRGRKNLIPYFKEHKDLWKKLYDKVCVKLAETDETNMQTFVQMLGIENIEERFSSTPVDECVE